MKIKTYCNMKDCINWKFIEWDGGFIENWICEKCMEEKVLEKWEDVEE